MASATIKFSVGIPAFKVKFFEECLKSILNQTYPNFELVIVDDHSPENIKEIVDQFKDNRITYFRNDINVGSVSVVRNWNITLNKVSGDFFVLMGDDDVMEPDYLETFAELIEKYPHLDVFHCRSKLIDENSIPFRFSQSWPEYESVYENIWHRMFGSRTQFISDFVYRLDILKHNGGFYDLPLAWGSDDVSSYIACGAKGIAHTNKAVFKYRKSIYTLSMSGNAERKIDAIIGKEVWLNEFLKAVPANTDDQIFRDDIKRGMKKYFQKLKVNTAAQSINGPGLKWLFNKKKYGFKVSDIVYIYLLYIKRIIVK